MTGSPVLKKTLIFNLIIGNIVAQVLLLPIESWLNKVLGFILVSVLLTLAVRLLLKFCHQAQFWLFQLLACVLLAVGFGILTTVILFSIFGLIQNGLSLGTWIVFKLSWVGGFLLIPVWLALGLLNFIFLTLLTKSARGQRANKIPNSRA